MLDQESIKLIYSELLLVSGKPSVADDDVPLMYMRHYLPTDKTIRILDAGCGNGKYAYKLAEIYNNIDAVDLFEGIKTDNKFTYQQASIDCLPFEDSIFDFLYSNSVIYYLPDPEKGIIEFNRVLKLGGILFFTAHTRYSLFTLWRIIKRSIMPNSVWHLKGVSFYTAAQYSVWLKRNGFETIHIDGYRLSMFIHPLYAKCVRACDRLLGIRPPLLKDEITKTKLMAKIKSVFGYHFILVARKVRNI